MGKQYAERDIESLDEVGGFYSRHVSAMTGEGLHTKSSVAAELGHRDMVISELLEALQQCIPHLREQAKNDGHAFGTLQLVNHVINKATGEER